MTRPPSPLTPDEVRRLIRAASGRAPTGVRNRAMIAMLYGSGLRLGEALALYPRNFDPDTGEVEVEHGKGDRARRVAIEDGCLAYVERWLDTRRALGLNGRHPLFSTLKGGAMKTSYVRALLPRLARRAGIERRVHAHGLRHTRAAEMAKGGLPMNVIQAALGHASLATTSIYLRGLAPADVLDAMRALPSALTASVD